MSDTQQYTYCTKTFAKNETETSVEVLMLTRQTFKGMFYSNEQALNSKKWLNVGANSKSVSYSKE